jgi:hypothetical protein
VSANSEFSGCHARLGFCSHSLQVRISTRTRGTTTHAPSSNPAVDAPCPGMVSVVRDGHSTCSSSRTAVYTFGPLGTGATRICDIVAQTLEPSVAWLGTRWRLSCAVGGLIFRRAWLKWQGIQVHGFGSGLAGKILIDIEIT